MRSLSSANGSTDGAFCGQMMVRKNSDFNLKFVQIHVPCNHPILVHDREQESTRVHSPDEGEVVYDIPRAEQTAVA